MPATKTKATKPKPTKAELDRWAELEAQRLDLARKAKNISAEQEEIEKKCLAYAQSESGKARPAVVSCSGYQLELIAKRASVQWKNEYIRVAGSDAAAELTAAAETKDAIKIHAPK